MVQVYGFGYSIADDLVRDHPFSSVHSIVSLAVEKLQYQQLAVTLPLESTGDNPTNQGAKT